MKSVLSFLHQLTVILTLAVASSWSAHLMAADVENCALCHKYSGLGRIDETGKKHLYYINEDLFQQSVHGKIRCKECHSEIKKYPHTAVKKVDCSTVCHLIDPSTGKNFSHATMIEKYELSVHGRRDDAGNLKEYAEDLPECIYCHENRRERIEITGLRLYPLWTIND